MIAMRQGQKEVLSFLGPPGSGKGTIAQLWQRERDDVSILSTGDLCRSHVREKTPFGREFEAHLAKGNLIPDELISRMVNQWLCEQKELRFEHIVLDGYPRTAPQVGHWAAMMRDDLPNFALRVVLFELSDDVIVDRLSNRIVCENMSCQKVYSAARGLTECSLCSGTLMRRPDDEPEVVRKRLAVYAKHKEELLAAYEEHNVRIEIFDVEGIAFDDMFTQFSKVLRAVAVSG